MFKFMLKLSTLLFVAVTAMSSANCQTTFEIGAGYRRDDIRWKIRERDFDTPIAFAPDLTILPGSKTRLRYKDMDIFLLSAKLRTMDTCYYFRASADYGWICNGKVCECFHIPSNAFDGFETRFSQKFNNKIDDDYVADLNAGIGYPFFFGCECEWMIAPLIGYSWHQQEIETKCRRFFEGIPPLLASGFIIEDGCNHNKHRFTWYGPYVGLDISYALDTCWSLYAELEYHFCGNAKRKREFCDLEWDIFNHHKTRDAQGFVGTIGTNFFFDCNWYAGLSVDLKYWDSEKKRNDLRWTSWGINGNLGYLF